MTRTETDTLRDKERGEERKWQLDQEQAFRARMRATRLLATSVAERLGLEAGAAADYAHKAVEAAVTEGDVLPRLAGDLRAAGLPADDLEVLAARATERARTQIAEEAAAG